MTGSPPMVAVIDIMETDLRQKLIEFNQETTIYTDEGQPVQVVAEKMVKSLHGSRREFQQGLYNKGNSVQYSFERYRGHNNFNLLYQD